ncbi:MAG: TIGR01777 family oxidoreductase [Bacteroidota bacterium]
MQKILVTGSSGLIGRKLVLYLSSKNYIVHQLSRTKDYNKPHHYFWDIEKGIIEESALIGVDHIIHLAGAGIAEKRWTKQRKEEIIKSRVKSTEILFHEVFKLNVKPKTLISASAIGYYGTSTSDKTFIEEDIPGNDFLGTVCKLWEDSSLRFNDLDIRNVRLRLGSVLSTEGGALPKMMLPIKLGIGSALGTGKQFVPWIHIDDVIKIFEWSIQNENMAGSYNVVASEYKTYSEFVKVIAEKLNKPLFMPNISRFILKMALGEMSQIVLEGSKISNQKIIDSGYTFSFPTLESAISNLFSEPKQ